MKKIYQTILKKKLTKEANNKLKQDFQEVLKSNLTQSEKRKKFSKLMNEYEIPEQFEKFLNNWIEKELTEELIQRAEAFLSSKDVKYYSPKSSRSIIQGELKLFKEGKPNELEKFLISIEKLHLRYKEKEIERQTEHKKVEDYQIDLILKDLDEKQILKKINKLNDRNKILQERWKKIRVDERTQRKARIVNEINQNYRMITLYEKSIDKLHEMEKKTT